MAIFLWGWPRDSESKCHAQFRKRKSSDTEQAGVQVNLAYRTVASSVQYVLNLVGLYKKEAVESSGSGKPKEET